MTDAKRKSMAGLNLLLVFVLTFGLSACSLKWGDDARRAAADYERQQHQQKQIQQQQLAQQQSDSTKTDSAKADSTRADSTTAKIKAESSADSNQSDEPRVRFVRIGKGRRLTMVVNPNAKADSKSAASLSGATGIDRKLSNNKSRADFSKLKAIPPAAGPVRYPGRQMFGAGIDDSVWIANSGKTLCELVHPIPHYGRGIFRQRSGRDMSFMVYVNRNHARRNDFSEYVKVNNPLFTDKYPYPVAGAKLESIPPVWKALASKTYLGFIPIKPGRKPFSLPHRKRIPAQLAQAQVVSVGKAQPRKLQLAAVEKYLPEIWPERLLAELEEGMSLRLTYRDWADGRDDVMVTVSALNFVSAIPEFEACIKKLQRFNFTDFSTITFNYNKNSNFLNKKAKSLLDALIGHLKTEPDIKGVKIVAYTDSVGFTRVNHDLSIKFANIVKGYLVKRNVDYSITAFGAGEGGYISDNRTRTGRAKNQRIVITLIDE